MNPPYTFSNLNPESIVSFQSQQHLAHQLQSNSSSSLVSNATLGLPNPCPSTSSNDTTTSSESSPSSSISSTSSDCSKKRSLLQLECKTSSTSSPSGPSVPSSPAADGPSTNSKPPPSKKRKKNGTTHSKLIEEFAQRSHVRNSVNLSSYHGKKQNIKTLCPYHDMLPVIEVMEKEVFNRAKGNSIKKEYCNMLPIIRNHCEWTCSGSPYKLECRNLLMRAKELYEYEFDLNDIAMPFMNAVVLGGPNPNICIQLLPASQQSAPNTLPPGQFRITFKPLQNLSLLERNETCNIALKAISCGTFKRNLQPVPDACRITKLLDGDGCFVTVDKGQNTSSGTRGNQSVYFKVSTCEVRQRRKLQGTDSVLGVGFDCASRLSWQKPRIYWMHQSIHTMRDKKSKKIVEKKHISNRDLRFSILVPYDFTGSVVVFMIGIQEDRHYNINTSIPCKRYSNSTGDGNVSGTETSTNFNGMNGINGYNPGLQSPVSHIKNDQMLPPSSLSISGEQPMEHSQDIALQNAPMTHFQATTSSNGQSPNTNSSGSTNDTLTSNVSNGCNIAPIPPLPNITPSSVSIQPSLSLNNTAAGESQSANASPNTKLNLIQNNSLSNNTTTTTTTTTNTNTNSNPNGGEQNGTTSINITSTNSSFPPPPTNQQLTTFSPLFTNNNTVTTSDWPSKLNLQALNASNGQFLAPNATDPQPVPSQGLQAGFSGNSIITASTPISPYRAVTGPQAQSFLTTLPMNTVNTMNPMNTMSVNGMNPMNAINTMSVNGMGNPNGNLMYSQAPPSVIMNGMNSVNGINGMFGGNGTVGPNTVMDAHDSTQSLIQPPSAISVYSTVNNNTTINNTINNTMHSMAMANQSRDRGSRVSLNENKSKFIESDLENGHKAHIELLRSVNFREERFQTLASKWIRTCIERYTQNEDIYHLYLLNIVQSLINCIGDDKTVRGLKRCWMSYNNTENEWSFLHMICSKNLLYLFESMANLLVSYKHELMVSMASTPKESQLGITPLYCCVINSHHQFSKYLMDYFLLTLQPHDLVRILQNGTPSDPSNCMVHHLITYQHNETLQALYNKNASRNQETRFLSPDQVQLMERHLQINNTHSGGDGEMSGMQISFNNAFSK